MELKENARIKERIAAACLIGGVIVSLVLLFPNMTGEPILKITQSTSNSLGVIIFVISLVTSLFLLKSRKKKN